MATRRNESQAWEDWSSRILGLLGVDADQLRGGSLLQPWFLVPQGEELSKESAADLFRTVRRRFLLTEAFDPSVQNVRGMIRRMRPEEILPLLYAMRHVARYHGSAGRYWPAFRDEVLDGRFTLADVQQKLGPVLGAAWRNLHLYTRQRLYLPREGREIIKWPLAHAGLLRNDEGTLAEFGMVLGAAHRSAREAPLARERLDDFLRALSAWLVEEQDDDRLLRLVSASDGTERTVGELAQRWIRHNWEQISAGRLPPAPPKVRSHSGSLRYDAAENRVVLVVGRGAWPGDVAVRVVWEGREIPVPSRFSATDQRTEHDALRLPLLRPAWGEELLLLAGEERRRVHVPRPPEGRGIVFRAGDGRATDRWMPGEEYYAIVADDHIEDRLLGAIFEEWTLLGSPEGWEGYRVLFCRVRDPVTPSTAGTQPPSPAAIADTFDRAARALGLPGFGHLWQPRARLVGGESLSVSTEEPTFSTEEPPYLEVRGAWEKPLPAVLLRRKEQGDRPVVVDRVDIPAPRPGQSRLVELWPEEPPAPGLYRLSVGNLPEIDLRLTPPQTPSVAERLAVRLEIQTPDGFTLVEDPTPADLERGTLVMEAWPYALLTLDVSIGSQSRSFQTQADDAGEWRARWRDLGLPARYAGKVTLTFSWRGLARDRLEVSDAPFVAEEDLEVERRKNGPREHCTVRGRVSNRGTAHNARVVLLGARPWAGDLQTATARLDGKGCFEVDLPTGVMPVRWVVVLPAERLSDPPARPWLVRALARPPALPERLSLEELRSPRGEGWRELVLALERVSLPPALRDMLDLHELAESISECPDWSASRASWLALEGVDDLARVSDWAGEGRNPDLLILADTPQGFVGSWLEPSLPRLCISAEELAVVARDVAGSLPLTALSPGGSCRRLKSRIEVTEDGRPPFVLSLGETLYACPKCYTILPPGDFEYHTPPAPGMPPCSAGRRSMRVWGEGKRQPVWLFFRSDPERIADGISSLVFEIAAGSDPDVPPRAEPWLEELEAAFEENPHQDATDWLVALPILTRKLRRVRRRGGATTELLDLGRQARRHRSGLRVFWRWLEGETG